MVAMTPRPTSEHLARRAELLAHCGPGETDELDRLTAELGAIMGSEALVIRRLDRSEPTDVVDRLVAAEPVHPFDGPADLADRLDEDRRCFVLEHPELPGRPLNIVWCALWSGVPTDLAAILDPAAPTADPAAADTAVFYSIWNVEPGLVGLPGGRTLLLGAVAALREELPGLSTFVTLSPIPGFRVWLESDATDPAEATDGATERRLAECARYLTSLRDDGRPLDAVARFHLGNGARLLAVAANADRSERGMDRSYGLMANYRYEPEDRAANRAALGDGHVVVGDQVAELLRLAPPTP
jgi:malonyl-CoA decarboxylase